MSKSGGCTRVVLLVTFLGLVVTAACGKTIGETMNDATITTRVKTALLNDPSVPVQIDVKTSAGIVTLSGTVPSRAEADRAVQLARGVEGVKDVKEDLKIEGQKQRAGRQ